MPKQRTIKLPKHHYIPVFYLKQWTGEAGQLCEFSRKYKEVKPRRTTPDGTGYVRGLYRLPNVPEDKAEIIETGYMKQVDNYAACALQVLLDPKRGPADLTHKLKIYWARFLHCLVLRNPQYLGAVETVLKRHFEAGIDRYRADYERFRTERDPPTFEEFVVRFRSNPLNTSAARIIHMLIDSETV